jgi:hypothetical protein
VDIVDLGRRDAGVGKSRDDCSRQVGNRSSRRPIREFQTGFSAELRTLRSSHSRRRGGHVDDRTGGGTTIPGGGTTTPGGVDDHLKVRNDKRNHEQKKRPIQD